ncbi:MAG TPA: ATP synthase F0 subunit B [Bryobacteraceae bacterium]|nr:ATP synthase F0 subunit B [Bryobacteraceae bacterium]
MRRLVLLMTFCVLGLLGQEHGAPAGEHGGEHGGGTKEVSIWWKWANFAILAAGLGYLISKNAPGFFASRNEEIRKGLDEGARLQREANERTAAMEARLRNLQGEIDGMKTKAKSEIAAEGDRIQAETAAQVAKIQAHATSEIAAAAKNERAILKNFAADLALAMAEEKLRGRLTPQADAGLIQGFLKGLN